MSIGEDPIVTMTVCESLTDHHRQMIDPTRRFQPPTPPEARRFSASWATGRGYMLMSIKV
jgi:hypothetical protein